MTDKRSILFQILFAVFDSLQGFVIVMVHCILRREVEPFLFGMQREDKGKLSSRFYPDKLEQNLEKKKHSSP